MRFLQSRFINSPLLRGSGIVAAGGTPTDTGFVIAGTGTSVSNGNEAWVNPGNITADDGTSAQNFDPSDFLVASNFGFSIPGGATVTGFEVRAQLSSSGAAVYDFVNIGKDGSTLGTSKDPNQTLTGTLTNYDAGGNPDLWGLSWTPAEVNASTFQARIACLSEEDEDIFCDAIWVKVYYTA